MRKSSKLFVGMDVHKDSIDVATGDEANKRVQRIETAIREELPQRRWRPVRSSYGSGLLG